MCEFKETSVSEEQIAAVHTDHEGHQILLSTPYILHLLFCLLLVKKWQKTSRFFILSYSDRASVMSRSVKARRRDATSEDPQSERGERDGPPRLLRSFTHQQVKLRSSSQEGIHRIKGDKYFP